MSYPWIARQTKSQQRRRPVPHQGARIKQLRVAMLLALSGGLLWSMRSAHAAEPLPVASVPVAGPTTNVANFGAATLSNPNTTTLQVNQTSDKAIIQWNSFNIDAGHTVNFSQPSTTAATLNNVGGNAPSVIAGLLKTSLSSDPGKVGGQIYLINTNGILFATGATVDVNTLTASTLKITDDVFKAGILSVAKNNGTLTPVFSGTGAEGDVTVDAGATLTAQSGGRIMLVAPNVHNQGIIKAPDGQIILAAGAKVYLQASEDPSLRGLLVEVASGCGTDPCTASNVAENLGGTNLGQLLAQRGNITLVGLAVNQLGHVSATTSVNANGSIELLAETDPTYAIDTNSSNGFRANATHTGTVTIGANSVTEVTPELADPTAVVDEQSVLPSKITAVGETVDVQSNSRITATSGQVTLSATADLSNLDPTTQLLNRGATADGSRVYIDKSAVIDVSGTKNVVLPMSHNLVQLQLYANELADSPLQRNGILRGQTVTVDARVGTPLANVSGAIAGIKRTIAERTTSGGTVNLQSTGDVIVNKGATIDVSGGSKQYQGGSLDTTKLLSNGVTYDIGSASPDRVYDGIAGLFIKTYARWGVTESWGIVGPAAGNTASYVPGYVEGADAGTVNINTFHVQQDGTLLGNVIAGPYQRNVGTVNSAVCNAACQAATYVPQGGQLIIGDPTFAPSLPVARIGDVLFGNAFAAPSLGLDENRLVSTDPIPTTQLDTAFLTAGGFTRLAIYSDGLISLPQDTTLNTAPGGSVSLTGRQIDIAGSIHTPGGSVNLGTRYVANEAADSSHDLTLEKQARIDTAGLWVNDLPQGQTPATLAPTAINGGSVTVNASGNLDLVAGSLIDVSGGAWLNSSGKLQLGKGGNVSLATTQADTTLSLGANLRGYAPGAGGTLSVTTDAVCIGAQACAGQTNPLLLDPVFFRQGGFGNYVVTANVNGLTVASGAAIAPLAQNLVPASNYTLQPSGSDIYGFSTLTTLPNGQRKPVNITLESNSKGVVATPGPDTGVLTVAAGASITGDAGAALTLKSDRRIDVEGTLAAPAGSITLRVVKPPSNLVDQGFDPGQSIWLGADSALLAGGTTQWVPNAFGLRQGQVLAGGTITLDAQRGYVVAQQGSQVNVSGTVGTLDLSQGNGSYQSTSVASGGGTVNISAAEGVLWDGSMAAQPGATNVAGGTLNVTLTRANAGLGCDSNGCTSYPNPFPMIDRNIVLQNGAGTVPEGLAPGAAIDISLNGQALLDTALINNSGFDNVALTSDRTIQFPDTAALTVRGTLRLDAQQIALTDGAQVNLDATYIGLGASETLYQDIGNAPTATSGTGTLKATASLIDLIGNVSLSGVKDTQLLSSGDLRLRGVRSNANQAALDGSLSTLGDLILQADQLYPTTFSNYTVNLQTAGSTLTIRPGTTPTAVLSAGGALILNAPNIIDKGVLKAPLGSIKLNGSDTLQLAAGSLTSTSAEGQIIPFGTVQNGSSWSYDFGGSKPATIAAPPAKAITLGGTNIKVDSGATLDLSGGGDLLGYEFVPGPGGSKDVLSPANAPNSYAVLPGLGGSAFAPFDPQYYQGSTLQPGNSIYLSGGGGLAAGTYALLPARYALLPGAFLVTAVSGYQDQPPGTNYSLLNGATVVPGYRTLADTGIRADQRWSGFSVQPGPGTKPSIYASEFDITTANAFYTKIAATAGTLVPRLPVDAGQLAINAASGLTLDGQLLAAPGTLPVAGGTATQSGRGAQVDIVATNLDVVNSIDPNNSDVQLLASELNGFGAESLLLGALRSSASDGTLLSVGASTVTIGPNVVLSGPELLLAAHDKVTVDSGAQLTATGKLANTTPDTLIFGRNGNAGDGNGALLRLSVGPQAAIRRENSDGTSGSLEVQSNTLLSTPGALALDATFSNQSFGTLAVTGSLSLGAPQINLGAVPANTLGLTLDNNQLASFTHLTQLVLRSYGSVDLYGATVLGSLDASNKPTLQSLSIEGAGLLGFKDAGGGDASASITAGTVSLGNPGNVKTQETANGTGTLQIHAIGSPGSGGEIDLAAGDFAVAGFNSTTLTADSQSVAQGKGSLAVAGDLTLVTPRLTAQGGADYTINAAGHTLSLAASGATPAGLAAAPNAGKLSLTAADVNLAGRIDLPAGVLAVTADNGINLSGSINAAGVAQAFAGQAAYLSGGTVTLSTTAGDIAINTGASINVAGASQGGAAGQLNLNAPQGAVQIDSAAQISGQAASGYQAGSFTLDESALADFSGLNTLLNNNGFIQQRTLRVRNGNVAIAAGDTVQAHDFHLTADRGTLDVAGKINASGADGGNIMLASSGALTLEQGALLDAHALGKTVTDSTDPNNPVPLTMGDGGTVSLSTGNTGSLNLNGGTIDVTPVDSRSTLQQSRAGQIYLRAPQTGSDVAISTIGTTFTGLENTYNYPGMQGTTNQVNITAEAYRAYTASTIDNALISTVTGDSSSFMNSNAATITNRLGMSGDAAFHLTPGIEIDSGSDLTLAANWDLHSYDGAYNGGVAGVLTLRATGNLNLNNSLSDGFSSALSNASQTSGSTWSYRLVGGADLASPDALAVLPAAQLANESGNVNIANGKLVRTGNGRIDVAAGGDIKFGDQTDAQQGDQKSVLYTAGTVATITDFTKTAGFNYATAGGDITLSAQHDVLGAVTDQMISNWIFRKGVIDSGKMTTLTTWGLSFANFQQNVGALGGGDITVKAGNDVNNLSAVIPTTGYLGGSTNALPDPSKLTVLGGGNLSVNAGGNVGSGIFYVGRGNGRITAGDGLTSARTVSADDGTPLYTVLAAGDASFNVQARNDAIVETVLNPTLLPQSSAQTGVGIRTKSYFSTYASDSAVNVQSLAGNIIFDNNVALLSNSINLAFSGSEFDMMAVYPGTLRATAYHGDIVSNGDMKLYPAPLANLQLLASGDVSMASINMSDADPNVLPQPLAPAISSGAALELLSSSSSHAPVPVHNQPGNPDLQPALIVADGNITGQYFLPKSVQVSAGNDILDLNLIAQNLRSSDITSVIAGHNISYPSLDPDGNLFVDTNVIQIGGPGALLVQAGGTIDLGTSTGILTSANLNNHNLPAQGADVTVAAGITPTPDYSAFMTAVLDPSGLPPASDPGYAAAYKYVQQLTGYMTTFENLPTGTLSDAQAYADFKALPATTQLQFLQPLTRETFIDRYLDPAGPLTTYGNAVTQTGGKYYGTDPSGNGKYLTDYMTAYEGITPGTLSDAQALVDFRALSAQAQQVFMLRVFYQELRLTGRAHTNGGFDYQRGLDAISALFPAGNYQGDLNLAFSQIRTLAGGNINLLVPGGLTIVGLPNPPAGLAKGPDQLGIVAQGAGDVSAFVKGDFLVNQSRVFTLLGGNILIWSTEGNIDAGRGAKSAITVPPPTVVTNVDGTTTFKFQGAATGSGIREILTSSDITPGDVDLIAPKGEVNAGDAGIGAAGNLNIAAQQVVGADNIQVGGVSSGVPASDNSAVSAGLTGTSNLGGDANKLADDVSKNLGGGDANGTLAYLSVDVLGFGDDKPSDKSGDCKPGDENCSQ